MKKHITPRDNFAYLTIALLAFLLLSAALHQFLGGAIGGRLIEALTVLTLVGGVWSVKEVRAYFRIGIALTVGIAIVSATGVLLDHSGLTIFHLLILLCFFCLTTWAALKQVFLSGRVDGNAIVGAICVYLLLGLIWAVLFMLLEQMLPGSFNGLDTDDPGGHLDALTYFSFVSLTTMGFGDITPALPLARYFTYLEGVVGEFYVATLVASLVGVRVSAWQQK